MQCTQTKRRSSRSLPIMVILAGLMLALPTAPVRALDAEHETKAERAIARAFDYLRESQSDDGSWTPEPGPGVTGLVLSGMLRSPGVDRTDATVAKGVNYLLQRQKPDGGIYDRYAKNYNTGICLMALGRLKPDERISDSIHRAQRFLKDLQWQTGMKDPKGNPVNEDHPYFGGAGYNDSKWGRPDLSNTSIMLAGLYDSGVSSSDPVFQRAVIYIQRLQGIEANDMFGDKIVQNGGLIYSPAITEDYLGMPESKANPKMIEAARKAARTGEPFDWDESEKLRPYGSMSYAGYMSFLYADLAPDDHRVQALKDYLLDHYTVEANPAMGQKSYYYYMMMFGRAWKANGEASLTLNDGQTHDWANDLIDELTERQREDGSWVNKAAPNWMENHPPLATAYALIALQCALGR